MEQLLIGGKDGDVVNINYKCVEYIAHLKEMYKNDKTYIPYANIIDDLIMTIVHDSEADDLLKDIPPEFHHPHILSEIYPFKLTIPSFVCHPDGSIWCLLPLVEPYCIAVEEFYTKIVKYKMDKMDKK
jgi:hypothetical protein